MLFPTAEYGIFFLVVFTAAWAARRHLVAHKLVLLAASYVFYAWGDWRFLPVLVGLSLLAALVGKALEVAEPRGLRGAILAGGVSAALSCLVLFKYSGFFAAATISAADALGVALPVPRLPEVALPVGISFFVFHAISLMVDAWRRRIPVSIRTLDALLYVAFFPQLVAGPILRAASFLPELQRPRDPEALDVARALQLLAAGLFKKVVLASFLATRLVDPVFESPAGRSGLEVLLGVYGYAAQIYCDFSGYTDLALGSALLLGYALPKNFDAPYRAQSPQDFWRRWHLSLSTWLRDYLFIPLGGSKHGPWRTAAALAVTMVLGGLWHGAAWTFVVWGAFHAAGLLVHRVWASTPATQPVRAHPLWALAAPVLTFHFVCAGWVLFRAQSLGLAGELFSALFRQGTTALVTTAAVAAVALGLFSQFLPAGTVQAATARFARLPLPVQGAAFGLLVMALEAMGPRGIAPFIYFRF